MTVKSSTLSAAFLPGPEPLEAVIRTEELQRRVRRPPDFEVDSKALIALAKHLANFPETILQKLTEVAVEMLNAGSAGVSLLDKQTGDFYWPAIAGAWRPNIGAGTPRNFGPCGTVLDRDSVLLFAHPERHFPYLLAASPAIEEALLTPFYVAGKAVGTVWLISHDASRRFDLEDQRVLNTLGEFAAAAYQALEAIEATTAARDIAVRASAAKDRFLAALSHELRTPLNPILLVAGDAANNPALSADARADFELIRKNIELETRLIEDLLDLTRATHGKMSVNLQPIDLGEVVRDAIRNTAEETAAKNIVLSQSLPASLPRVAGDAVRLQQVFWNLLRNAVKFTPANGSVRVVASVVEAGDRVTVEVSDTGIGLTPAEIASIFVPFAQGEHADGPRGSMQFGGLGLGLSISAEIMTLHEGTLSVASRGPGLGATFTVALPLQMNGPTEPGAHSPFPGRINSKIKPLRIVIVEDHETTRSAMKRLLEMRGHHVTVFSSGLEFQHKPELAADLVLCDIGLPDVNGYDFFREIHEERPALKGFALSGYGTKEDMRRAKEAGFAEHFVKPVAMAQLDWALTKHFSA